VSRQISHHRVNSVLASGTRFESFVYRFSEAARQTLKEQKSENTAITNLHVFRILIRRQGRIKSSPVAFSNLSIWLRTLSASLASGRFSPEHSSLMKKDITKSSRTVLIKVESLDTDYDFRDKDLRSPNWFDAEKYPFIKFQSKRVIRKGSSIEAVGTTINQKDFGVKGDN
jgi:hypothetical protein